MTHVNSVDVPELRQNLFRYLMEVKDGSSFRIIEGGREVARLIPSVSELPPAVGPPSSEILDEQREERL